MYRLQRVLETRERERERQTLHTPCLFGYK